MARIPYVPVPQVSQAKLGANAGRQNVSGVSAGAFGAMSNPQVNSYMGTALQGVGRQLADVADPWAKAAMQDLERIQKEKWEQQRAVEAEELRLQNYKDNANVMDYSLSVANRFDEARVSITGDGTGFARGFTESIAKEAAALKKSQPNQIPRDFDLRIKALQNEYQLKATMVERETRDRFYKADIDRSEGEMLSRLSANPDPVVRDNLVKQMQERIDRSGMNPATKELYKRKVQEDADLAYAYGLKEKNPDQVVADLGGQTSFNRKVAGDESGNNHAVGRHPGSSAYGKYGFITETWKAVANSPEGKAAGLTEDGYKSEAQQDIGMNILTKQNKRALEAANVEPTEKNLKLAHFLGAGGATKMIREMVKDGDRSAADLFPAEAKANPKVFYYQDGSPRSLSAVYDRQTRGYGGNKPEVGNDDPILARLPINERMKVLQGAENEIGSRLRMEDAQRKAQFDEFLNDAALRIRSGEYGMGHVNAMVESGQVTNIKDIQKLEGLVKEYTEKVTDFEIGSARIAAGEQLNRFDSRDVKQVNAVAEQRLAVTSPEKHDDQLAAIWEQTSVVPDALGARIRNGAVSQNPQVIQRYGELAAKMLTDPNAFQGAKGEQELEEFGHRWIGMLTAGLLPAEAAAKISQMNEGSAKSPQIKQVDELKKKLIDSPPLQDIINGLGFNGWFETSAQAKSPAVQGAMNADYMRLFLDEYMITGDEKSAKGYALSKMKNTWGVFEGQMMKFPPDKAGYKPVGQENPYKWVQEAATTEAVRFSGGPVSRAELISDGQTIRERAAGAKPSYQLVYWKDVDGTEIMYSTPGFRYADPKNTDYKAAEEKFQAEMAVRGAGLKFPGEVSQRRNESPQMAADRANREILRKQAEDAARAGPPLAERDRLDAEALAVPKGAPAPARYVRGMRVPGGQ